MRCALFLLAVTATSAHAQGQAALAGKVYPSAAAARAAKPGVDLARTSAVTVLADEGDVLEISTKVGADCLGTMLEPYEITGYAPRGSFVPRLVAPLAMTFPDGSAVAVDAGALVATSQLVGAVLGALDLELPKDGTALVVPPLKRAQPLPVTQARRLACGTDCLYDGKSATKINGTRVTLPEDYGDSHAAYLTAGGKLRLMDVELTCGRVRVATRGARSAGQAGMLQMLSMMSMAPAVRINPGPLFWEDGTPAGADTKGGGYDPRDLVTVGKLRCFEHPGIAARLCHRAEDVITASP